MSSQDFTNFEKLIVEHDDVFRNRFFLRAGCALAGGKRQTNKLSNSPGGAAAVIRERDVCSVL